MATAINDFIQGIIMLFGISTIIAAVLKSKGGFMAALDGLEADVWGSKNLSARLELADVLETAAAGSKNILLEQTLSDTLAAVTAATTQTTETASFQLTIRPAGSCALTAARLPSPWTAGTSYTPSPAIGSRSPGNCCACSSRARPAGSWRDSSSIRRDSYDRSF